MTDPQLWDQPPKLRHGGSFNVNTTVSGIVLSQKRDIAISCAE